MSMFPWGKTGRTIYGACSAESFLKEIHGILLGPLYIWEKKTHLRKSDTKSVTFGLN